MSCCSDTRIGAADSDTVLLRVSPGERVRLAAGTLDGIDGIVVQNRAGGRVLVRIGEGLNVEIDQYCVEGIVQPCQGNEGTDQTLSALRPAD